MADNQSPQVPPIPVPSSDESANLDANRPDSFTPYEVAGTKMADPAQSAITDNRPISSNLADSDSVNMADSVTESTATQSAEIKPESPEKPQEAPLADTKSPADSPGVKEPEASSSPISFGDLLSGSANPAPSVPVPSIPLDSSNPPLTSSDQPAPSNQKSFGDLIKEIKPEDSVILPPPVPSHPPPTTNNLQPTFSPISPTTPTSLQQKANQARTQRKTDHLSKILELSKNKGKINNKEVRGLLRVSQSTATNYLSELVKRGSLKREKHAKATFYY